MVQCGTILHKWGIESSIDLWHPTVAKYTNISFHAYDIAISPHFNDRKPRQNGINGKYENEWKRIVKYISQWKTTHINE